MKEVGGGQDEGGRGRGKMLCRWSDISDVCAAMNMSTFADTSAVERV